MPPPSTSRFFALRPLYQEPQSRTGVPVPALDPNGAILPDGGTSTAFQAVDAEEWARTFLADVDLFLSAPYAAALRAGTASVALDRLLRVRTTLAGAIARGVDSVLVASDDDPGAQAGRGAAIQAIAQTCETGLLAGYDLPTIVQESVAGDALTVVPQPLRTQPQVPLLLDQTAEAMHTAPPAPSLTQAGRWAFACTCSHAFAGVDEVLVAVTFDVDRHPSAAVTGSRPDLITALGVYVSLAPRLRELMASLVSPPSPVPANLEAVRDGVSATIATLAETVAAAWYGHWLRIGEPARPASQDDAPSGERHHFQIAIERAGDDGLLEALTLTLDGSRSPAPSGRWPDVSVRAADGTFVPLDGEAATATATARRYVSPAPVTFDGPPTVRLRWPDLEVAAVANARASLAARRNAHLLPGATTNPAFVLTSTTATAATPTTPLLRWNVAIPVAGATLGAALTTAFEDLFGGATGRPLDIALSYAVEVAPGIGTVVPVALLPRLTLSAKTPGDLEAVATQWTAQHTPSTAGARWLVALTLTSWLDAAAPPLLVLDHLAVPVASRPLP